MDFTIYLDDDGNQVSDLLSANQKTKPMTPEEFARQMRDIAAENGTKYGDPELTHLQADRLMLRALESLGYGEGCKAFQGMKKWYS